MVHDNNISGAVRLLVMVAVAWLVPTALLLSAKGAHVWAHGPDTGDNLMRLVQIRDWLAGQGWFDTMQYRLNAPEGVAMHWSRLVDAPIGAMITGFAPIIGVKHAEALASIVWPLTLLFGLMMAMAFAARAMISQTGAYFALGLSIFAVTVVSHFGPGRIDHHNVQLFLMAVMLAVVPMLRTNVWAAMGAGLICSLSISIGLETLPFIVVAVAWVVISWIFSNQDERTAYALSAFGASLAVSALGIFAVTTPSAHYLAVACDNFSYAYLTLAVTGGAGLAVLAAASSQMQLRSSRFMAALLVGAILLAIIALINPACLSGPYAHVDATMKSIWLSRVEEAKGLFAFAQNSPGVAWSMTVIPLLGLVSLCVLKSTDDGLVNKPAEWWLVTALLVAAIAIMLVQVRAAPFAHLFAILPCALVLSKLNTYRARLNHSVLSGALVLTALVCSTGVAQSLVGSEIIAPLMQKEHKKPVGNCGNAEDYAVLAGLKKGLILNEIDLAPSLLAYTPHGVVSGPYHRNVQGIKRAHFTLVSPPYTSWAMMANANAQYIVFCRNGATYRDAAHRPIALIRQLADGQVPAWLTPIKLSPNSNLMAFKRVAPGSQQQKSPSYATLHLRGSMVDGLEALDQLADAGSGQLTPVPPKPQ